MRNEHRYSLFRLCHFLSGLFVGLLFILGPRKKNRIIFNSSHNKLYNFNSKFLFELFLTKPDWECRFVIDDESMRRKLCKEVGPYFISSRSLSKKLYILSASTWVTSSLETPVGGLGLSFRRLVINLGHGTPIKATGIADINAGWIKRLYYALIRTNFNFFLASTEKAAEFVQKAFGCGRDKILISCQPRLVSILEVKDSKDDEVSILYAPTWRKSGQPRIFPFEDYNKEALEQFLHSNGIKIWLRLHPFFESSAYTAQFLSQRVSMLSTREAPEVMDVLGGFNILITDYSSIYVDYLILNRPILFFPYDLEVYQKNTSFMAPYEELTPGPHIHSQKDFLAELEKFLNGNDSYSESRQLLNRLLNGNSTAPGEDVYQFINAKLSRQP